MKNDLPIIRLRGRGEWLLGRDGFVVSFFIHRDHTEVAPAIWGAVQTYRRAIPPGSLNWYTSDDGDMVPLDEEGWEHNRREVIDCLEGGGRTVELRESPSETGGYQVEYYGRLLDSPFHDAPVTALAFTFPSEYFLEHGADHLRALALELARELPFNFGYVSFALVSTQGAWASADWTVLDGLLSRYLGLDVYSVGKAGSVIGTHSLGPHWLTFLGRPLLGRLGGIDAMRRALSFPEVSLRPMEGDRLLVTLGEGPDPIDTEKGAIPSQYLALGRLLKPFMFEYTGDIDEMQGKMNCWRRRLCP
ncbi:type VI immunity family protein [Corallococcus exercitus]|uniref:type VI immunity family protein n=1 Tax=Corallococcus exercitus TaxID=2316736 RepID=UPI0035D46161